MAVNGINSNYSTNFRLVGLSSGLDTDSMVKSMMMVERMPLNRLVQQKQLTEWRRDDYRSITNLLRGLRDTYFDVLKPSGNMLSQNSYKKYVGTSTNSSIVTVTGDSQSVAGSSTISVYNLATAGKAEGGTVTNSLVGGAVHNYDLSGKTIKINLDGITREVTLDSYSDLEDMISKADTGLQTLIDKAFGSGKIQVNYDVSTQVIAFKTIGGASKITLYSGSVNDGLDELGFTAGASNRLDINQSLDSLKDKFANSLTFNSDGKLKFTINSKEFTFDRSVTLVGMMNTISLDSTANVSMKYDETKDKFTITAKQLGVGDNIIIEESQEGNFFGLSGASGIKTGNATIIQGIDAKVKLNGEELVRSSNTFTVNGATYTLLKAHSNPGTQSETLALTVDVDGVFNNIKSFVDKYNEAITEINKKLDEKYDKNFPPLTDDQRADMSEDDIKKWEEKAKVGLLRNDSMLQGIVYNMRTALYDSVEGVAGNLPAIGITTGSYLEKGILKIDENKLKEAIKNDPDTVMNLFSKKSSADSNIDISSEQRTQRYKEQGLAWRLSDIIDNNIRTIRDANGRKGMLLEKAGIQGDASEFTNMIYKDLNDYEKRINDLNIRLLAKENSYYAKFASLEKIMSSMNSQRDWLTSQLGQM